VLSLLSSPHEDETRDIEDTKKGNKKPIDIVILRGRTIVEHTVRISLNAVITRKKHELIVGTL
jgi:hypothetical protein